LSSDLVERLQAIASANFAGVKMIDNDLLSFSGSAADVRRIAVVLGLEILACRPFRDFESMPANKRDRVFGRAERKFDVAQQLGCDLLVVCSNTAADSVGDMVPTANDLRQLGKRAGAHGLRVGLWGSQRPNPARRPVAPHRRRARYDHAW
jgi:4-hydroxyphenylpyruvate dioxygenase